MQKNAFSFTFILKFHPFSCKALTYFLAKYSFNEYIDFGAAQPKMVYFGKDFISNLKVDLQVLYTG